MRRTLWFLAFAANMLAASATGQALRADPGSIVTQHIEAYLAAVEAPSAADVFVNRDIAPAYKEAASARAIMIFLAAQKRVAGGYTLEGVRMTGPRRAEALLRDRIYGARHSLTLEFDDTPEARIVEFDPGPAPTWAPPLPRVLSAAEVAAAVRRPVERGCAAGVFAGAVLVARHGEVLFEKGCGLANRRYDAPNTPATRFNLASINKMFTAVAIMQLVEAGKVSLDDPLSKYADESWLPVDVSKGITVRQLITHTSGLGSFIGPEWGRLARNQFRELADYKPLVRSDRPSFPPGSGWSYSNTGPLLAGVVIEKASGENYFAYVRRHIFMPAGMDDTESWAMDEVVPNLAMGYYVAGSGTDWRENIAQNVFRGSPAGGGYSTVGDLLRFADALEAGKLVSKSSLDFMWTDHPPHNYGAGFVIETTAAGKSYGHDGIFAGVSTRFHIFPETGYVVAILANQDYAAPGLDEALTEVFAQTKRPNAPPRRRPRRPGRFPG